MRLSVWQTLHPCCGPITALAVPNPGTYTELLNSDAKEFGGTGVCNGPVKAVKKAHAGFEHYISVKVPPMAAVLFRCRKSARARPANGRRKARAGHKAKGRPGGRLPERQSRRLKSEAIRL